MCTDVVSNCFCKLPPRLVLSTVASLMVSWDLGYPSLPQTLETSSQRGPVQGTSLLNPVNLHLWTNNKLIWLKIVNFFLQLYGVLINISLFFVDRGESAYRFIYFNHMNLAQKTTVHSDYRKTGGVSIPPETLRLLTDISTDMSRYCHRFFCCVSKTYVMSFIKLKSHISTM